MLVRLVIGLFLIIILLVGGVTLRPAEITNISSDFRARMLSSTVDRSLILYYRDNYNLPMNLNELKEKGLLDIEDSELSQYNYKRLSSNKFELKYLDTANRPFYTLHSNEELPSKISSNNNFEAVDMYHITVPKTEHQDIVCTVVTPKGNVKILNNGQEGDYWYNSSFMISVIPHEGYIAGNSNPTAKVDYKLKQDINISVGDAERIVLNFSVPVTPHQQVVYKIIDFDTKNVTYVKSGETKQVRYWDTYELVSITADTGFKAGSAGDEASKKGTIKQDLVMNLTEAKDLRALVEVKKYTTSLWAGSVRGQGNVGAAYNAAWACHDRYESEKNLWVDLKNGSYQGSGISYKWTVYQAIRVVYPYEYPGMIMDVKWIVEDGGNGIVTGEVKKITPYHYNVVLAGHGGDKGHYGAGRVEVTMTAPGLDDWKFKGRYWINSD